MSVAGFTLAIFPYFLFKSGGIKSVSTIRVPKLPASYTAKNVYWVQGGLLILFWIWAFVLFKKYPIDIAHSDILPFINDILLKRFMNGEQVYALVNGFNNYPNAFTPNYFPFHWLPFSIAYLFKLDLRVTVLFFFSLSSWYYVKCNLKNAPVGLVTLFLLQLPLLIALSILAKQGADFAANIEVLIMAYYLFLASSVFKESSAVKAFGLVFPFLSRYAFLFWLPAYFYALMRKKFTSAFYTGLIFGALVLALFVIPFVRTNPEILKQSGDIYIDGAMGEWKGQSWQAPGDKPFQLFQGMGFASWFYTWGTGTLRENIITLKSILMYACLLSALLPLLVYKKASKYLSTSWFSLLSLKFCLTIFYAFIMVPYLYLFWVPMVVSAVILMKAHLEEELA
ncbi:MAG: hypothetical protein CFE21_09910 [Bacteroidetes bacterium B1(2017)]|nr:MAG: hypothetical protein CFE21_09910 [Bacteroidetes bacterium B1(2017)]